MRRLYADKLVVILAVLIVLLSALFALVQSSFSHTQRERVPQVRRWDSAGR